MRNMRHSAHTHMNHFIFGETFLPTQGLIGEDDFVTK